MWCFSPPIACAILLLGTAPAQTNDSCIKTCDQDVECWVAEVECLVSSDRAREAIDRLKPVVARNPEHGAFVQLLARAYLEESNPFWAQRTLQAAIERNPANCETRSHLAWVHITQGDLDLARDVLSDPGPTATEQNLRSWSPPKKLTGIGPKTEPFPSPVCPAPEAKNNRLKMSVTLAEPGSAAFGPDRPRCPSNEQEEARWQLINLYIGQLEGHTAKRGEVLDTISESCSVFPEDYELWSRMRDEEQPGWIEPVGIRMDLLGGYTSNARAGSPTDPGEEGKPSPLGRLDLFGRFVAPTSHFVRPFFETGLKGNMLTTEGVKSLSYAEMSGRPGLILGRDTPRLAVGYRADLLILQNKKKRHFYEGHRAELDLDATKTITAFLGGGRRVFREGGRTRWEIDGGAGGSIALSRRVRALFAGALRYYDAVGEPYDQLGGTGLLMTRVQLVHGAYARIGASLGFDYYLSSGGPLGVLAFGTSEKRQDLLLKLSLGAWSPPWGSARVGLRYDLAFRDSTADKTTGVDNYDYTEHRTTLGIRWTPTWDPFAPRAVEPKGHIAIDYGWGEVDSSGLDDERVQDLLRQDEAARRGSSCVD